MDSSYKFNIDEYDLRAKYFEQGEIADSNSECGWSWSLESEREWEAEQNLQRVEEEIDQALTMTGEVVRAKGFFVEEGAAEELQVARQWEQEVKGTGAPIRRSGGLRFRMIYFIPLLLSPSSRATFYHKKNIPKPIAKRKNYSIRHK
jgi:hypothetical protein